MSSIQILPADLSHVEMLVNLSSKTFYDSYAHANTKEDMELYIHENFSEEEIKKELEDQNTFLFLAFSEGKPVGYVKLGTATSPKQLEGKSVMEIERIYVLKEYQSMKIGKVLLKYSVTFAKEKRIKVLWLGVWIGNLRAIKFYEREGFKKFGIKPFTLGRDLQEDFMMKIEL